MVVPEAREIVVREAGVLAAGTPQRRLGLPSALWHASGMTPEGTQASTVRRSVRRLRRASFRFNVSLRGARRHDKSLCLNVR